MLKGKVGNLEAEVEELKEEVEALKAKKSQSISMRRAMRSVLANSVISRLKGTQIQIFPLPAVLCRLCTSLKRLS